MTFKVRITKDKTKDMQWAVEMFKDNEWKIERRFKNRARCQDLINYMYTSSDQLKDYVYKAK